MLKIVRRPKSNLMKRYLVRNKCTATESSTIQRRSNLIRNNIQQISSEKQSILKTLSRITTVLTNRPIKLRVSSSSSRARWSRSGMYRARINLIVIEMMRNRNKRTTNVKTEEGEIEVANSNKIAQVAQATNIFRQMHSKFHKKNPNRWLLRRSIISKIMTNKLTIAVSRSIFAKDSLFDWLLFDYWLGKEGGAAYHQNNYTHF